MHLAVVGASGRLGRQVLRVAGERGHTVKAAARSAPFSLGGIDAVILTIGPPTPHDPPECAATTAAILQAMREHGVERILCVTGAMIGDYPDNRTWLFGALARAIERKYPELMADRAKQEQLIRSSGLRWTIFKPPRLTMGAGHRNVAVGPHVRAGLLSAVSRSDLARLLVEEAEHNHYEGRCVFLRTGIL